MLLVSGVLVNFCLENFSVKCTTGPAEAHWVTLLAGAGLIKAQRISDLTYVIHNRFIDKRANFSLLTPMASQILGQTFNHICCDPDATT